MEPVVVEWYINRLRAFSPNGIATANPKPNVAGSIWVINVNGNTSEVNGRAEALDTICNSLARLVT